MAALGFNSARSIRFKPRAATEGRPYNLKDVSQYHNAISNTTRTRIIPGKLKTFVHSVFAPPGTCSRRSHRCTLKPFGIFKSRSGPGSNLTRTAKLRNELPILLQEIGVRSILDAPCGDFNWMKDTALALERYVGVDIIPELLARNQNLYGNDRTEFLLLDLTRDRLPRVDLILCRDCFIHFSYRHITSAIKNFKRSRSTYLLTNTYQEWHHDRKHSYRRLPLCKPPVASLQLSTAS